MTNSGEKPDLLIAGASARACAFSVLRTGLRPYCFDQFADADLRAAAPVERIKRYPDDLPQLMDRFDGTPWMYTGALENYPDIVDEITKKHPLLGNSSAVLAKIRDPFQVAERLSDAAVAMADLRREDDPPTADGTWLLKPIRGGGGIGIRIWDATASRDYRHGECRKTYYFQKYLRGESYSVLFAGDGISAKLLGSTRQLIGRSDFYAAAFAYCGSIGPVVWDAAQTSHIQRLGHLLAEQGGLVGLFGCDLMVGVDDETGAERISLIEVNPRYPASAEVLERATGRSTIWEHLDGCLRAQVELERFSALPSSQKERTDTGQSPFVGKGVLYAPQKIIVKTPLSESGLLYDSLLADVPQCGETIEAGHPVCTIFSEGTSLAQCEQHLHGRASIISRKICDP